MKTLLRLSLAVCLALVCGCRANVSHELLERELLAQENQIYQLEDTVNECSARLDSCQRENEALLAELGRSRSGKTATKRAAVDAEELTPPVVEPGVDGPALPYDGPPVISPPDPHVPEGDHVTKSAAGPKSRLAARGKASSDGPIDQVVTQITLNRKLTGGHNVDGHPGDEGVMVVVEPLNAAGDLVEVPAKISIVVLDPAVEGEGARVARWDFDAKEAAGYVKRTPMGDGLHFDLRWPHSPPVHRVLNLYVRYTTADGRRLQVEKQIEVDPPGGGDSPDRWTKDEPSSPKLSAVQGKDGEPRARATTVRSTPEIDEPASTARRDSDSPSAQKRGPEWAPYR
ncbi:MAG TPA: hypothetical protein VFI31_12010 [Pirellulales bacterium]|nr:hypothetical protein [Pirellulales bacterium]